MQHIQRRGHVEDDHIVSNVPEKAADDLCGKIGGHHGPFGLFCLLVAWNDIEIFPGGYNDIRDGFFFCDQSIQPGRFIDSQRKCHMTLRIEIDQQGFLSCHGQAMREGDSGRSLAYAAFLIGNREYCHRCFPYKNTNGRW